MKRFRNLSRSLTAVIIAVAASWMSAAADLSKVVIIKADDFRGTTGAWTNFLDVSRAAGVKVAIGVIADSIQNKTSDWAWMRAQERQGDVEFWTHAWDHKQWTTNGQTVSEFQGSGLAHQREHLARSQALLKTALGRDVIAFGTAYNGFDADTATVINESPELRLFFTHRLAAAKDLLTNRVEVLDVISEGDGTGKPNAEKLAATLAKRPPGPVSLQFHPPYFDPPHLEEYRKILANLKAQGYAMLLPSEYVALCATNRPQ